MTSRLHPWRVAVVFAFGLLHGMGFAEALAGLHLSPSSFVTTLVSFNLGVEAGQLAVIAAAALVLAIVTSSTRHRERTHRPTRLGWRSAWRVRSGRFNGSPADSSGLRLLADRDVAFEPRDFFLAHVFADLAAELLDAVVGPVFLELAQHAVAEAGDRQNVLVAGRVQVDGHEHVLLQPRELRLVDVFVDLAPKHGERHVRPVLLELAQHAVAQPGISRISSVTRCSG